MYLNSCISHLFHLPTVASKIFKTNPDPFNLARFTDAQKNTYETALAEIRNGQKVTHWIWFIFPQFAGAFTSEMSKKYAIRSLAEAQAYLNHPKLGPRLDEITQALLDCNTGTVEALFGGTIDASKLHACTTLFQRAALNRGSFEVDFQMVLNKYFGGQLHGETESLLDLAETSGGTDTNTGDGPNSPT